MQNASARARNIAAPLLAAAECGMYQLMVWVIRRPNLAQACAMIACAQH